jgi:hypothetical protein
VGLWERLLRIELPALPVHQLMAAIGEFERGKMTLAQIVAAFGLNATEETEVSALTDKIIAQPESYPIGSFVTLTNVGSAYDATPGSRGLGFVAVDVTGITRLEMRIRYNKIGTGALSWQLWNETNEEELGVFEDAAAAGDNRVAAIVVVPSSPMSGGVKLLRARVKSTAPADDPVYYGACIFLRRVERLTSQELHEILCLAEKQMGPYTSVAALKSRLGVT